MTDVAVYRKVIKAAVTAQGAKALKNISEAYGMKEYIVAGRLFDWFAGQDDIFQRSVLGMLKGLEQDAAREFMRRLAEKPKAADELSDEPGVIGDQPPDATPKTSHQSEEPNGTPNPGIRARRR